MKLQVILLPKHLEQHHLANRAVVVFDVLRATTTIAAAFSQGISEIRVYGSLEQAREAASTCDGPRLLCGEERCLKPPGFDLGNSPRAFDRSHHGHTMFLATTNGTQAFIAARAARLLMAGALVNATAVARALAEDRLDVTLLCAGTDGQIALEDVIGAGAVIDSLARITTLQPACDASKMAALLYRENRHRLDETITETCGGMNIRAAGLGDDISFAAAVDSLDVVGVVKEIAADCLTLRRAN